MMANNKQLNFFEIFLVYIQADVTYLPNQIAYSRAYSQIYLANPRLNRLSFWQVFAEAYIICAALNSTFYKK